MKERKNVNSVSELLVLYRSYLEDEERSAATVDKYLRDVKAFMEYLAGEKAVGNPDSEKQDHASGQEEKTVLLPAVDREVIRNYKQALKERYKIASANSMLAALNSFFVFMGREDLKVKLFKIQRTLYCKPELEMTGKDYERLVQAARRKNDHMMSMLIQTIGSTGIRISELRFITVESLKRGRAEIYNKGKSRVVLIPVELTRLLRKYCRKNGIQSGSIFITRSGNPVDRSNVSKRMKQLGREAGVDTAKVFPHNLRHLFARTFYNIEKDVVRLMDLLGHSSINTSRIYTADTEDQPRRQMSRMKLVLG